MEAQRRNIEFSPPEIIEDDIQEVANVLRSGWITTGPKTKEFEKAIQERVGSSGCICLNSQTASAEMALRVCGIGPGDEVITSAYTYTASASVICHVGATPVLVDIGDDGLQMDYDAVESAITSKTKAIIPVDVAGIPCDYDRIMRIAESSRPGFSPSDNPIQKRLGRVAVISDSAHSFGATYGNAASGALADFSAFSFHAVKNLTTAEGGALTWTDAVDGEELYQRLQHLSLHGQSKDAFSKKGAGSWEYDVLGPWYKCNMTDIAAALGLSQLRRYDRNLARRKAIIEAYDEILRPIGVVSLNHYDNSHQSSGHLYISRVPWLTESQRNDVIVKMGELGIACNVHYKPLPLLTAYKDLGFDIADYPQAEGFYQQEITLPVHMLLSDEDVEYVATTYRDVLTSLK